MTSAFPDENGRTWPDWAALAYLVAACAVYMLLSARVEAYGSDTSTYFGLAQSLLSGEGYRFNLTPHAVYPPGYPIILAAVMSVVGQSFRAVLLATVPIYFIGLACVYGLLRRERSPGVALAVIMLAGTSYVAFFWTTAGLHSDVSYFAISACALLCIDLVERGTTSSRTRIVALGAGTLCIAWLPLVRSIGIALWAGLCLWAALPFVLPRLREGAPSAARLRRWLPAVVLTVVSLGGWMAWSGRVDGYAGDGHMGSYVQQVMKGDPHEIDSPNVTMLQLPGRSVRMAGIRVRRTTAMILNLPTRSFSWTNPVAAALMLGLLLTVGVGFVRSVTTRATVTDCYVLAYGAVLLLWPFDEGQRFMFPLHPFLLLYGVEGFDSVGRAVLERGPWERWGGRLLVAGQGLVFVGLLAAGVSSAAPFARRHLAAQPSVGTNDATLRVVEWIRAETSPDAVVMVDESAILHRLTGRRTYRFPLFTDPVRLEELIEDTGARYIVVLDEEEGAGYFRPNTESRFGPVRARDPERFPMLYDFGAGWVYGVQPAAGS